MVIPYSFMKYAAQAESRATTVSAGFSVHLNETSVSSRVMAAQRNSAKDAKKRQFVRALQGDQRTERLPGRQVVQRHQCQGKQQHQPGRCDGR
jgi:hypothetical protein